MKIRCPLSHSLVTGHAHCRQLGFTGTPERRGKGSPQGTESSCHSLEAGGLVREKMTWKLVSGGHTIPWTVLAVVPSPGTQSPSLQGPQVPSQLPSGAEEPELPRGGP